MNRVWFVAKAMFVGLCTTQFLATWHVYLSNMELDRTVSAIRAAGYLSIPNTLVAPSLKQLGPAFFGGGFFSLSLGAGLSLFSLALAWAWDRLFSRSRSLLPLMAIPWVALVVSVNLQGFSPMVTAYFVVVPAVVFAVTLKWMPLEDENKWLNRIIPLAPIALLTVVWTAQADRYLFLDIRDFLLLSNPVGQKIDDSYYRYTLYPAQVFKTLQQKTLKTCRLGSMKSATQAGRLSAALIRHDYLPLPSNPADMEVVESENGLALKHEGIPVLLTTAEEFLSRPQEVLGAFSSKTDRHASFRRMTIIGLLLGFPVLLYVMIFAFIRFVSWSFVPPATSSAVAALLCLLMGLALLVPLHFKRSKAVPAGQVSEALNAPSWRQHVSGLRTVVDEKLEIGRFPNYRDLLASPHLPERYWLAKALGSSRQPQTYAPLLSLLDDPHPNVVSMAFYGLGQRGERRAVKEILKRLEVSDHWYNQWYAYRALRALGWRQNIPKSTAYAIF